MRYWSLSHWQPKNTSANTNTVTLTIIIFIHENQRTHYLKPNLWNHTTAHAYKLSWHLLVYIDQVCVLQAKIEVEISITYLFL